MGIPFQDWKPITQITGLLLLKTKDGQCSGATGTSKTFRSIALVIQQSLQAKKRKRRCR